MILRAWNAKTQSLNPQTTGRQRRREMGAVIMRAGDAKLRSGDALGACDVYLKV